MPKISVVMPVFNTNVNFLSKSIESILNQTYSDFEFLVIDNGSDSYIKEFVDTYKDDRIKYHRIEKNQGPALARNYGIDLAKGEYIAFMDSDDISFSTRFEKQLNFLDNNPEVGCLGTTFETINDITKNTYLKHIQKDNDAIVFYLTFIGCLYAQSSIMVRKSVLDLHNIRYKAELVPAEDYGFYVDLIGKTKFAGLDEKLVQYMYYLTNTSNIYNNEQKNKTERIKKNAIKKYFTNLSNKKLDIIYGFFSYNSLSYSELYEVRDIIQNFILKNTKSNQNAFAILKKAIRKKYHKTKSLIEQINLIRSGIGKVVNLSFLFQLKCLITRGIL